MSPSSPPRNPGAILLALILGLAPGLHAQNPPERIAFDAAVRSLEAGFAEKAAADLAEFLRLNPESPLVPEAILLEVRARASLDKLDDAARLLGERLNRLGPARAQGLQLLAELNLRRGAFAAAAEAYHRLTAEAVEPPVLLQAAFGEALALFRSGAHARAAELLTGPTNAFARAVAGRPNDELALRGSLLLAEARLRTGDAASASAALDRLTNRPLTPVQAWERQLLVTSLLQTNHQAQAALAATERLVELAQAAASRDLVARSHNLRGDVFAEADQPGAAFAAFTNNLAEGTPPEWRRDALLAISELPLDPPLLDPAAVLLTPLAASPSQDAAATAARIAVAALRLQQYFAATNRPGAPPTNALAEARPLLLAALSNNPAPPLAGRALFHLGWWELASGRPGPAGDTFAQAAAVLPPSTLQGLALFKLADCQMLATNHAAAKTNYLRVIRDFGDHPVLRPALLERALYQGALAALKAGDQALATELAGRAVLDFPEGEFRNDTRLLYGQTLARFAPPSRARDILQQLATRLTDSPTLPEIQIALARSYLREGAWTNALQQLDDWSRAHPRHPGIPRAEFERAWAAFKTGDAPRAYGLFTNFLARFPDDPAAPQAQMWVGDHLYRTGNYAAAEGSYQLVFQRTNWPVSRLTFEARLMAGRAAFARQGYKDAKPYFRWLIANGPPAVTNSFVPPQLVARAYFALGDAFLLEPESDDKLGDAMTAFAAVIEKFPGSREALLAQGKLAGCHFSRAELDPTQAAASYTNAARLYLDIVANPAADIASRSQAEVGLALVREKQAAGATGPERDAALKEALGHLLNVFHGSNLRPGEIASPFWLNRAGVDAGRLAEALGLRDQAAAVYEALARTFPAAADSFRQRAAQLRPQ